MGKCKCGCGGLVNKGKVFISGHNLKNLKRTKIHNEKIGDAQRKAWLEKRVRKPIGSKNLDNKGYVRVKIFKGSGEWKKEHILIMEKSIGRKLKTGELVHHIDGNKKNNNIENLFLCRDKKEHHKIEHSCMELMREMYLNGEVIFNRETKRYEKVN